MDNQAKKASAKVKGEKEKDKQDMSLAVVSLPGAAEQASSIVEQGSEVADMIAAAAALLPKTGRPPGSKNKVKLSLDASGISKRTLKEAAWTLD